MGNYRTRKVVYSTMTTTKFAREIKEEEVGRESSQV